MRFVAALLLFFTFSLPANALEEEQFSTQTLMDNISKYVDTPAGSLDWQILGMTKEIQHTETDKEGFTNEYVTAEFTEAVKALDGKTITIKGYMFPLGETDRQPLFLFGPFPVGCPYHYHVGPSLVIEVHADAAPVKFSYDPIVITGTFETIVNDPDGRGLFYRLKNARQVQ